MAGGGALISEVEVPRRFNVASWFVDRNLEQGRGEQVALDSGEEVCTYARLAELTCRAGNALRELGVRAATAYFATRRRRGGRRAAT